MVSLSMSSASLSQQQQQQQPPLAHPRLPLSASTSKQSNQKIKPTGRPRKLFMYISSVVCVGIWLTVFIQIGFHTMSTFHQLSDNSSTTSSSAASSSSFTQVLNDFVSMSSTTTTTTAAASNTSTSHPTPSTRNGGPAYSTVTSTIETGASTTTVTDTAVRMAPKARSYQSHSIHRPGHDKRRKLQEKLDQYYIDHGYSYNETDLWQLSDYVPRWMKGYFDWHKRHLPQLNRAIEEALVVYDNKPKHGGDGGGDDKENPSSEKRQQCVLETLRANDYKLFVMQCLKSADSKCGGTADRLKPFLFMLKEAAVHRRLLFLHWTSPALVDEFLVPPVGGYDWRAPTWLQHFLDSPIINSLVPPSERGNLLLSYKDIQQLRNSTATTSTVQGAQPISASWPSSPSIPFSLDTPIIRTRLQSQTGFEEHYDNKDDYRTIVTLTETIDIHDNDDYYDPPFKDVYHDVWRIAFRPSKPVAELIEKEFVTMATASMTTSLSLPSSASSSTLLSHNSGLLIPGQYTGIHLRAMYGARQFRTTTELTDMVNNGLNCGSQVQSEYGNNKRQVVGQIKSDDYFFASDLRHALELAVQYGRSKNVSVHVVTSHNSSDNNGNPEQSLTNDNDNNKNSNGDGGNKHVDGPLHFAKASDLHSRQPSEFYSTFVDLFILGMARCTVVNRGGFGTFGSLVSYNASCLISQKTSSKGIQHRCDWLDHHNDNHDYDKNTTRKKDDKIKPLHETQDLRPERWPPLFLDPMP